jgi:hypothetical protein
MITKMTHAARAELTGVVRKRYYAAAGAEKRKKRRSFSMPSK